MFINIKTNTPADSQDVLIKFEDGTITGARYCCIDKNIETNFKPLCVYLDNPYHFDYSRRIVSWMSLDALTS